MTYQMLLRRIAVVAVTLALTATGIAQRGLSPAAHLRVAIDTEMVDGDLPSAIRQYQAILDAGGDPEVVTIARTRLHAAQEPRPQSEALQVERIWTGPDVNFEGQPSPDGRYVAYVDYTRYANLAVRDLQTGEQHLLTHEGTGYSLTPVFSSDGRRIAHRYGQGQIYVRNVDGANVRVVPCGGPNTYCDGRVIYLEAWSPNGQYLAGNHDNGDGTNAIVLVSTTDGSMTQLISFPQVPSIGGFSPDGRFIVYALNGSTSEGGGVFTVGVDGRGGTPLVEGSNQGTTNFREPVWSPDGRQVFFLSNRSGQFALWSVRVSGGAPIGAPQLVRRGTDTMIPLGFARDGSFYYGESEAHTNAFIAEFDPVGLTIGKPIPITDQPIDNNAFPSVSPDGRHVAYVRVGSGGIGVPQGQGVVVIRTLETGAERVLTAYQGAYRAQGVQWFPDSRSILIRSRVDPRTLRFRQVNIETGVERVILEAPWNSGIGIGALSPDGKILFYWIAEGDRQIIRKRMLDSGTEVELSKHDGADNPFVGLFGLSVSPDGSQLAFGSIALRPDGNVQQIMTMPVTGGASRVLWQVTAKPEGSWVDPNSALAWTGDGRHLVMTCLLSGSTADLCALPVSGGEPKPLGVRMQEIPTRTVTPDGRRVAFTGRTTKSELWVIRGLLAEATAGR